jgi:hypothetical protein
LHCKHECTYEYNQQIRKPQVMTSFLTPLYLTVLLTDLRTETVRR